MRRWSLVSLWVCGLMLFAPPPILPDSHTPTLVVESVAPDSPAAKAGVKVGDRLLSYDGKPLPSPAALSAAQQNTFGKKEVALSLQRGNETLTLTVPLGALGIAVRPDLPPDVLKLYEQGNPSRDGNGAVKAWTAAAKAAQDAGDKAAAAWLYGRVGAIYESQRQWKEARQAHATAWELLKPLTPPASPLPKGGTAGGVAAAPQFADLQYPQPLDFQAAAATLDAGTLLLAYYVDEKETYLFVVKGKEGEARGSKGQEGAGRSGALLYRGEAAAYDCLDDRLRPSPQTQIQFPSFPIPQFPNAARPGRPGV